MIPRGAGETLVSCFTDVGAPGRILVYTFIYYCIINDTYLSAKTASAPKHGATVAIWRPWKSRTGSGCLIPFRLRDICASEGGIGKIGEALPARGAMRVLHRAGRLGSSRALSARIRRRRKPKPSSPTEPGGLAPTFLRRPMAPSLSGRRATGGNLCPAVGCLGGSGMGCGQQWPLPGADAQNQQHPAPFEKMTIRCRCACAAGVGLLGSALWMKTKSPPPSLSHRVRG